MKLIRQIGQLWVSPFEQERMLDRFEKAVLLFILYWAITNIPYARQFFGVGSWLPEAPVGSSPSALALGVLTRESIQPYWWVFMGVCVAGTVLAIFKKFRFISIALVWFTYTAMITRTYIFETGGNQLASLFLIYLVVAHIPMGIEWKPMLKRTALWLCRMQVIIVYVVSSIYKFLSPEWMDGSAVYYVFSIQAFSLPPITDWMISSPVVFKTLTYTSLAYQVLFPVFVWIPRIKVPFLIVGIFFHLGIAFLMGIMDFGLIMVISYLLFIEPDHPKKWLKKRARQLSVEQGQ